MTESNEKTEIRELIYGLLSSKNLVFIQLDTSGDKTISIANTKRFYIPPYKTMVVENFELGYVDIYFKNTTGEEKRKISLFIRDLAKSLRKLLLMFDVKIRIKKVDTEVFKKQS